MSNSDYAPSRSRGDGRRVFCIIPAAGQGRRMGRMKQLMPYRDGTLLDAVMDAALEAPIDGMVVVLNPMVAARYDDNPEEDLLIEINDDAESDMIDSLRLGLKRCEAEFSPVAQDGVLVLPGDQPEIGGGLIATCIEAFCTPRLAPGILVATYHGRRGHPAVFRMDVLREIENLDAGLGLNELAKRHPELVREIAITSSAMPTDVNTPEDYDRLMDR